MSEPVLLFTLVKKKNIREISWESPDGKIHQFTSMPGARFSATIEEKVPDKDEIERRAEYMRRKFNETYGCNHIIVYANTEPVKQIR